MCWQCFSCKRGNGRYRQEHIKAQASATAGCVHGRCMKQLGRTCILVQSSACTPSVSPYTPPLSHKLAYMGRYSLCICCCSCVTHAYQRCFQCLWHDAPWWCASVCKHPEAAQHIGLAVGQLLLLGCHLQAEPHASCRTRNCWPVSEALGEHVPFSSSYRRTICPQILQDSCGCLLSACRC